MLAKADFQNFDFILLPNRYFLDYLTCNLEFLFFFLNPLDAFWNVQIRVASSDWRLVIGAWIQFCIRAMDWGHVNCCKWSSLTFSPAPLAYPAFTFSTVLIFPWIISHSLKSFFFLMAALRGILLKCLIVQCNCLALCLCVHWSEPDKMGKKA